MMQVTVQGKAFNVEMPDMELEAGKLEFLKAEYRKGEVEFNPLWKKDRSNPEAVAADLTAMVKLLGEIQECPEVLVPHIEVIRKKKNGDFWKNSGTDVLVAENCTEYFTDFTNAWSALMIRLDVQSADTCRLSVRHRTFTL